MRDAARTGEGLEASLLKSVQSGDPEDSDTMNAYLVKIIPGNNEPEGKELLRVRMI